MQALIDYLNENELTQVSLAKKLGVNQGQLNSWLKGRRSPSAANLKRISKKTGISLERLVEDL